MTNHNHSISDGSFKRGWRLLFIFALAAAWLGQANLFHSTMATMATTTASTASEVNLRGQAAIDQLKKEGAYQSLSAAMAAARYQAQPLRAANAYQFANPAQSFNATLTPGQLRVTQASGKEQRDLVLKLAGYGYGEHIVELTPGAVEASQNRVESKHHSQISNPTSEITEWFVNTPQGIEHGFDLPAAPATERGAAALRVLLEIGGTFTAGLDASGETVQLTDARGAAGFSYGNLHVYDARRRNVAARFEVAGKYLAIAIDDREAEYPLTIDPLLAQQTRLTAADAAAGDSFGSAVALDGNTAIIGAYYDDVSATDQGSAYVFVRNGAVWTQQAKLVAVDGAESDVFGGAVALSGDTAAVGAYQAGGANIRQGAVYVFTRSGTVWSQQQKITAGDGATDDQFGFAVALSGDTLAVGAYFAAVNANSQQGAAYIFTRSGTTWTQQQKIAAGDGATFDAFGYALALSGDTLAAGAPGDTVGANATQGSAYVFTRSGATWTQQQKLTANDGMGDAAFGISIALSGNTLLTGALNTDIGANANQGAAYVFVRNGGSWAQQQKLTAIGGAAEDQFGFSVALNGDTAVVGAITHGSGPNQDRGAVWIFARAVATWSQQAKLAAADIVGGDRLGNAVALSGDTILAGAFLDDGAFADQGSAAVFTIRNNTFVQQQQFIAGDGAVNDQFGCAVALSGDTAVVGARYDDIGANTDQGSVYVFARNGATWAFQQKLTASDGALDDVFGFSVAISGDTLVVGALGDDIGANVNQGSAYVFARNGAAWTQQQKITANDGGPFDGFGFAVALSGDTLVASALYEDTGAGGDEGAVYVFARNGGAWTQQQKLTAADGAFTDNFGYSVALSGNTVLVGAWKDDIGANVDQGSVHVFVRSGAIWSPQQKITASDGGGNDEFGSYVALNDDTAAVGNGRGAAYVYVRNGATWSQQQKFPLGGFYAPVTLGSDILAVGAYGETIGGNAGQGAVYLFTRSGTTWTQLLPRLTASDGAAGDGLGFSVALSGDTVVTGAPSKKIGANLQQGAAYVFVSPACPTITLTPASLSNGLVGASYNQQLTASGGAGPYQFSFSGGTLPPGFSLAQNGLLSGTPMTAGTYNFTVTATASGSLCPGSRSYALVIASPCPTITVNPPTLPNGTAGTMYNQTLTASGGVSPYSFSVSAGALPNGITLSAAGVLSGAPTAFGNFNFAITATGAGGCTGARAYTLTINPPCGTITVNQATLPDGAVGMAYSQTATATGGAAPYTFTVSAGTLPGGLNLAPTGALTGTPNAAGAFNFTIKATDSGGCFGVRSYTVTITGVAANNGLQFYPLAHPVRLLDTRPGQIGCDAPGAQIPGNTSRTQTAAGRSCDGLTIPANARALVGNITTVQSGGGYLTLYPSDAQQPLVSNSNYTPNEIVNNVFTVGLGAADGAFKIFVITNTHLVVDVTGYYAPPAAGGLYFHPLPKPIRLLETRSGESGCFTPGVALQANTNTSQMGQIACGDVTIPATAKALVGNATTVGPQTGGYLTLYPADAAQPLVASSNFGAGQVINAPFTVGLSAAGAFNIFTTATTDLVIDVLGYYSTDANDANGAGLLFNPLPKPIRLLETRAGELGYDTPGAPILGGTTRTEQARITYDGVTISSAARAIVGNATVVNAQGGYLTFWPSNATQPLVATSNYQTGQVFNRHFTAGLGADGAFKIFALAQTDLVIDVAGFFAP